MKTFATFASACTLALVAAGGGRSDGRAAAEPIGPPAPAAADRDDGFDPKAMYTALRLMETLEDVGERAPAFLPGVSLAGMPLPNPQRLLALGFPPRSPETFAFLYEAVRARGRANALANR